MVDRGHITAAVLPCTVNTRSNLQNFKHLGYISVYVAENEYNHQTPLETFHWYLSAKHTPVYVVHSKYSMKTVQRHQYFNRLVMKYSMKRTSNRRSNTLVSSITTLSLGEQCCSTAVLTQQGGLATSPRCRDNEEKIVRHSGYANTCAACGWRPPTQS